MTRPSVICQGFQRGFVDAGSELFSVSASSRRATCEQILKRARSAGWSVVHAYLTSQTLRDAAASSIDGFAPGRLEPYFLQTTLSAFAAAGFPSRLRTSSGGPIFLISLAGLGPIAATFLDGLQRGLPIYIVTDAVADLADCGVSEEERLSAIDILARSHDRSVVSTDLAALASLSSAPARTLPARQPGEVAGVRPGEL